MIYQQQIETPLGSMLALATAQGICLLQFEDRSQLQQEIAAVRNKISLNLSAGSHRWLLLLQQELDAYFSGRLRQFSVPLHLTGTPFQTRVWQRLQNIPYGQTQSYQQHARALHQPGSVRAIASANGKNKIYLLLPCHRVIGSDGSLTGYGGGLWRKDFLLRLEKGQQENNLF